MEEEKTLYSNEEMKQNFKYIYIKNNSIMYATKAILPLEDEDIVYTFTYTDKFINEKKKWFNAAELEVDNGK